MSSDVSGERKRNRQTVPHSETIDQVTPVAIA